jgi:hypothetical protein
VPTQSNVGANNTLIAAGGSDQSYAAIPAPTTPAGSNVRIRGENVNLNFSNVAAAGNTMITAIDPNATGLTVPQGYTIVSNTPGYELATTASIGGGTTVCLRVLSNFDQTQFYRLKLMHGEGMALVDRTSTRNYLRREVCGAVTSFSPFVIAESQTPTAASVNIGGRVTAGKGRGIRNARVTITEANGATRTVATGSFGYYRFADVSAGQTVTISVFAKRFEFSSPTQIVNVTEGEENLNFTAEN